MNKKLLIVVLALGLASFLVWQKREWIGWQLASAEAAPVDVGPVSLVVPASLPARLLFDADGDVALTAGDIGYDAMALRAELMPMNERLDEEAASETVKRLSLALLADEPKAKLEERRFGPHPGFVSSAAVGRAMTYLAVAVADGALVRLEVQVRGEAPGKWREVAAASVASFSVADRVGEDGIWSAFAARAADACGGGDVDACLWSARSAWQRGALDDAKEAVEDGLARAGPLEVLWEEAKLDLVKSAAAIAQGELSAKLPTLSTTRGKRVANAVALHLLLGELELVAGQTARAVDAWERAWRYAGDGRVAKRLLEEGAALVDAETAPRWVQLARDIDQRFGDDPAIATAAAMVAARAGAYDVARPIARRVYDGHDEYDVKRAAVSVPVVAPPKLEPLVCGRGLTVRRRTTAVGTTEEACVDGAGKRRGPGRAWFTTTGYLLEEVTYTNDEPDAPDRRYWENGQLQRSSVVDARGHITVERWDPFGRPVVEAEGAEAAEGVVEVEDR